jgi:antitoxin PrlF
MARPIEDFLALLAQDLREHPEHVQSLGTELKARIAELTEDVEVDLDAPIEGDVEI